MGNSFTPPPIRGPVDDYKDEVKAQVKKELSEPPDDIPKLKNEVPPLAPIFELYPQHVPEDYMGITPEVGDDVWFFVIRPTDQGGISSAPAKLQFRHKLTGKWVVTAQNNPASGLMTCYGLGSGIDFSKEPKVNCWTWTNHRKRLEKVIKALEE